MWLKPDCNIARMEEKKENTDWQEEQLLAQQSCSDSA